MFFPAFYAVEDVEEALQMTAEEFQTSYGSPQPKKTDHNIVFYCMAGVRSWEAMECAHSLGYTKYDIIMKCSVH